MTRCWWSVVPILAFAVAVSDGRIGWAQFGGPRASQARQSPKTVSPALTAAITSGPVLPVPGGRSPEAALLVRANWDCVDTPLDQWLKSVSQRCGIPVFLAAEKLRDAGIDPGTPVSLELGDVPLHVALARVLHELGLDYAPEDGIFLVSTTEELDLRQSIRVYPVQDLVQGHDWESLMMAIQNSAGTMWEEVDGEGGTMSPVPVTGSLVVRQNWKTHRQIRSLLTALRTAARLQDVPSIPATPLGADDFEILPPVPLGQREAAEPAPARPRAPTPAWQIPRRYDEPGPRPAKPRTARPGAGFF